MKVVGVLRFRAPLQWNSELPCIAPNHKSLPTEYKGFTFIEDLQ
jgi:hypothetical protein